MIGGVIHLHILDNQIIYHQIIIQPHESRSGRVPCRRLIGAGDLDAGLNEAERAEALHKPLELSREVAPQLVVAHGQGVKQTIDVDCRTALRHRKTAQSN